MTPPTVMQFIGVLVGALFASAWVIVLVTNVYFSRLLRYLKSKDLETWQRLTGYNVLGTWVYGGRTGTRGIRFIFQETHPADDVIRGVRRKLRPLYWLILILTITIFILVAWLFIYSVWHLAFAT